MKYIDNNLLKGETVIYRAHLHWFFLVRDIILSCLLMALLIGFVLLPILLIRDIILIKTSEFAVTNKRVICKTGLVSRSTFETLITRIEGFGADQDIFGRMFGFGTISVRGVGGSQCSYKNIADPLEFKSAVQVQMEAVTAGGDTGQKA